VLPFGSGGWGGVDFVEQGGEIGGLGFIEASGAILRWQAEAIAGTADQAPLAAAFGVMTPGIALALKETHGDNLIDNARQFARRLGKSCVLVRTQSAFLRQKMAIVVGSSTTKIMHRAGWSRARTSGCGMRN
jgi:hypothetical protein